MNNFKLIHLIHRGDPSRYYHSSWDNLGVMSIKWYSTFPWSLKLELHFNIKLKISGRTGGGARGLSLQQGIQSMYSNLRQRGGITFVGNFPGLFFLHYFFLFKKAMGTFAHSKYILLITSKSRRRRYLNSSRLCTVRLIISCLAAIVWHVWRHSHKQIQLDTAE